MEEEDSIGERLAKRLREEQHWHDFPEEYPFYVVTFVQDGVPYQYGVLDEPRAWRGGGLNWARYRAFFAVAGGWDATAARMVADDFCRRVNKAEGGKVLSPSRRYRRHHPSERHLRSRRPEGRREVVFGDRQAYSTLPYSSSAPAEARSAALGDESNHARLNVVESSCPSREV